MNKTVLDLWVGFFVIAGIAALLFLALKVGSTSAIKASDSYEVVARFENIGGLKPRAPVKSAGWWSAVWRISSLTIKPMRPLSHFVSTSAMLFLRIVRRPS